MNILILSAGTRDKVVQYFKKAVGIRGRVVATDCSNVAPAIYEADAFYLVPRINAPNYLEEVLKICEKEQIDGVLSLIDPELSLIAKNRERFLEIGVTPIVSSYELCEVCLDKYEMYKMLTKMNIPTGKCYITKEAFYEALDQGEIAFPVFVKPAKGSASININKVSTREEVEVLFAGYDNLMVQEYMDGQEYGADVYIDMISHKCTSIFVKKKLKMRAGETDKSVSVRDERLFAMIQKFVEECGFVGMIDIDIFEIDGTYYISEVNPRFGGGYPHAYESGVDMPSQVVANLDGRENMVNIGSYQTGIVMMKYNEVMIRHIDADDIIM